MPLKDMQKGNPPRAGAKREDFLSLLEVSLNFEMKLPS